MRSPDSERAGLASFVGARGEWNGSDQWLAAHGQPSPTAMPASPFASRGSGRPIQMDWTDHSADGNLTGAPVPYATAARPLIGATRPIDEGDDGFTSGGTTNTTGFRRLDASSALSAPQSRLTTRPLAARRSPATISISMTGRVEAARWRKSGACFLRRVTHRSELVFLPFRRIPPFCRHNPQSVGRWGNASQAWA